MSSHPEWWQTFFQGLWQHVQPHFHTPEQTKKEADFIEEVLKIKPPADILDVPCGEGRLTIELASRGYRMSGIDMTEKFLNQAVDKARKRGLDITWHKGDMRKIPWENRFDAVLCMWGSFGYFDEEGNSEFIKAVSSSLRGGGSLLVDIHVAESLFPKYRPRGWNEVGGVLVLEDRSFDHTTGRVEVDWTFVRKGEQSTNHCSIRIYTYKEIEGLLREHGFTQFEAFGSLSRDPFEIGGTRLLMVARKT